MANSVPTLTGLDAAAFLEDSVNGAAQLIDPDITLTDPDGTVAGGTLTVAGTLPEDIVSIRNQGTGLGQVGFADGVVTWQGVFVGLASMVAGAFTVLFNSNASTAAVDAVLQNLTYANASDTPTASRTLEINITDGAGAAAIPPLSFTERLGTSNPFSGIALDLRSRPSFGDLDADGDLDAVVGAGLGNLYYFVNIGTADLPVFAAALVNPFGLADVGNDSAPVLADIDGDGDLDVFVGDSRFPGLGTVSYFQNTGTATTPAFAAPVVNPFGLTGLTGAFAPTFADLDGDSDLDAVVGDGAGNLHYFENTGTGGSPAFAPRVTNPFGLHDVGLRASLAFADLDGDGDLDALVGSDRFQPAELLGDPVLAGELRFFENVGTASAPEFAAAVLDPFGLAASGPRNTAPALADLDDDGDLDAVVGQVGGNLRYFENTSPPPLFAITVTVTAGNDAPVAQGGSASGSEDTLIAGILVATDADSPALTYSLVTQAAHGSVTVNADGRFVYTPDADFHGSDSFTFKASDGSLDSNIATVDLEVSAVNDAPSGGNSAPVLAGLDSPTFAENAVNAAPQLIDADVALTDSDDDFSGGTLTVRGLLSEDIVSIRHQGTGAGQIGFADGVVTYQGDFLGFAGIVAGTFRVLFGAAADTAAVDAVLQNLTYANASDTPTASRALEISLTDANGAAAIAPISFAERVGAANAFDGVDVGEGSAPTFADLDADGDLDAFVGDHLGGLHYLENTGTATAPAFASAILNPFGLTGAPGGLSAPAFADLDRDGDLDALVSEASTGNLNYFQNVGAANAPAFAAAVVNPFGLPDPGILFVRATFADLDADGDLDAFAGDLFGGLHYLENSGTATAPAFASAILNPFGLTSAPGGLSAPAFADLDRDGDLDVLVGSGGGNYRYFENIGTAGAPGFAAATANPFGLATVGQPSHPTFADLDADGDLDAAVGDGAGTLHYFENASPPLPLAITITVTAENDAPVAQTGSAEGDEDTVITGALSATDADSASLTYSLDRPATFGRVTVNPDGTFSYTPDPDFTGTDSFTFRASDGSRVSNVGGTNLIVRPANDAPVVTGAVTLAAIGADSGPRLITQAQLLANASDVDGPALSAVNLQIAAGAGTLVDLGNGIWSYAPASGDDSGATFTYQVTDGTASVAASATLDIVPEPQAPDPVIDGTAGDDGFVAPAGNSQFNGFGGRDTIAFDFKLVDAAISHSGDRVIVDGPSGQIVLTGFERFVFTDGIVDNDDGDVLVDDLFYYAQNRDVWDARADADAHYHGFGRHEGRDPNALFDTSLYLAINADVRASGADPLVHFDQTGWQQGRIPSLAFDPQAYLAAHPDVQAAGIDPLVHFLASGAGEGRLPVAPAAYFAADGFDYIHYLQNNPDVAAAGIDPLQHFRQIGWKEGRDPNALFDVAGYLAAYADVAAAGVNPFEHYGQHGWREGRDPSGGFDTSSYLAANPDVAAADVNPLSHFLLFGQHEGRSPFADGIFA